MPRPLKTGLELFNPSSEKQTFLCLLFTNLIVIVLCFVFAGHRAERHDLLWTSASTTGNATATQGFSIKGAQILFAFAMQSNKMKKGLK